MKALTAAIDRDEGIRAHSFDLSDGHGRHSKLSIRNHPGSDVTGMLGRCEKVAGTMEKVGQG